MMEEDSITPIQGSYLPNTSIDSTLFNMSYLSYVHSVSGIDIFALVNQSFFYDYYNHIKEANSYFFNKISNNPLCVDTLDYWLNVMISSSVWDEENDAVITQDHRNFFIAAEQLSLLYFESSSLNIVSFGGVNYQVAQNLSDAMDVYYDDFYQDLVTYYPNFNNLSEDIQDLVLTVAIIVATVQDDCGCSGANPTRDVCEDELQAALNAAWEKYQKERGKCWNQGKHSRCVHAAVARYEAARAEAFVAYNQCVAENNPQN